jgi:hypothetical protein
MAKTNIKFNNKNYSIDSASLADATARLEAHLMSMMEERLEGDGQEFYTMAPSTLSFRSTAPLNELQDVQINGQTVDPSNYALEEGSTIVKLKHEYLSTLDTGKYELSVVSDSKTVKGDFTVAAPELNEYGFYYDQPYFASWQIMSGFDQGGADSAIFLHTDGTASIYQTDSSNQYTTTYTYVDDTLVLGFESDQFDPGTLTGTFTNDGKTIIAHIECPGIFGDISGDFDFELSPDLVASDEYYIYTYNSAGYEYFPKVNTLSIYPATKNNILGIPVNCIAYEAFMGNDNLVSITIPNSVTSIGSSAFSGCTSLTSVEIGDSVTSIGSSAFYNCDSLTSVVIPDSVTSIGNGTFSSCNSLTSIQIPDSVVSIGDLAFSECTSLTSITIPDSVTSIGNGTFSGCRSLENVTIPNSVISIGDSAFYDCDSLTIIEIPNSVTSLGSHAFYGCSKLQKENGVHYADKWAIDSDTTSDCAKMSLRANTVGIADKAFSNHIYLINVTIPDSVMFIGEDAFYNCRSLTTINFEGTVAQWNTITKYDGWNSDIPATHVHCTDGDVAL